MNCLKRKGGKKGETDILHVPFCVFLAIIWKEEDWSCVGCIPKLLRTELHSCLRHHSELLRFCPHSWMIDTSVKGSVVWWPCLWSGRLRSPTEVDRNGHSSIFCLPSGENKAIVVGAGSANWDQRSVETVAIYPGGDVVRIPRPHRPSRLRRETQLFVCLLSAHIQFLMAFCCAAFCFHQLAHFFFRWAQTSPSLEILSQKIWEEKKKKKKIPQKKKINNGRGVGVKSTRNWWWQFLLLFLVEGFERWLLTHCVNRRAEWSDWGLREEVGGGGGGLEFRFTSGICCSFWNNDDWNKKLNWKQFNWPSFTATE